MSSEAITLRIEALFQAKNFEGVVSFVSELSDMTWDLFHVKGLALKFLNRISEAEKELENGLLLSPQNPILMTDLAEIKLTLGHSLEAKTLLDTAIQLAPEFGDPYLQMGWLHILSGEDQSALLYLDQAAGYLPGDSGPVTLKARALFNLEDFHSAYETFLRAIALNPDDIEAHYFASQTCLSLSDYPNMVGHLEQVYCPQLRNSLN